MVLLDAHDGVVCLSLPEEDHTSSHYRFSVFLDPLLHVLTEAALVALVALVSPLALVVILRSH